MRNNLTTGVDGVNSIEEYVKLLQNEVDFHNTVNLLTMYQPEEKKVTLVAEYSV
jgi:hypothetical protein